MVEKVLIMRCNISGKRFNKCELYNNVGECFLH